MSQAVSLSFYRFSGVRNRLWAFAMMGFARAPLARMREIGFWKLFGSGWDEGFYPTANPRTYAILATWDDPDTARAALSEAPLFRRYAARAEEAWTVILTPASVRGLWAGREPFAASQAGTDPALAVLTRATLNPAKIWRFWRRVPSVSRIIQANSDVLFKIGVGEIPLSNQVTFSIWPDTDTMTRFARRGPHAEAIARVRAENWFREELYARFAVHSDMGTWQGRSPLQRLETA